MKLHYFNLISMIVLVTIINGQDIKNIAEYLKRFDTLDIEGILKNDRIAKQYYKCFTNKGTCTPEANDIKRVLPYIVDTNCGDCTPDQKRIIRKIINTVKDNHGTEWKELVDVYDPKGLHLQQFLAATDSI